VGELQGQVALVTGAARGIGRAVARTLAGEGALVVCADCVDCTETVGGILADLGGAAESVVLDVTDAAAAAQAVRTLHERHGRLDILVNNAGITRDQLLVRMTEEAWRQVLAVNLDGVFNLTQPAAKVMMRQRSGRIVSIASVVAMMGNPGQCNYSASKAAIIGFTKSLARELGSRNVTVNAIAPGYIATAMTDGLDDGQRQALLASVAIPRLGQPEDVAAAVGFLAGPRASYITGVVLNVSGGLYM
jgi:3-oxoacyl-[acyl-carrier protein] reductase